MSPALPRDIVMRPFKSSISLVQSRIIISRTFQRILGELAMGRFISYTGGSPTQNDIYDQMLERLCRAYVYFVGLPFILNHQGQFISKSSVLRPFFEHWKMARDFFTRREAEHWKQVQNTDFRPWIQYVTARVGYDKSLYDEFNPQESLRQAERYKCSRLLKMGIDEDTRADALAGLMEKYLKPTAEPDMFFSVQAESVPLFSVFIGLDLAILFSNIYTMEIYRKGIGKKLDRTRIPAWMQYQSARLSTPDGVTRKAYFDAQGKVKFTLPVVTDIIRKATIDTYGLKTYIDLTKIGMEQYSLEPWSRESSDPPAMEWLLIDSWSYESHEPPEMEQVLTDYWGTDVPEMTLVLIEYWGTPPPAVSRVLYDDWSV